MGGDAQPQGALLGQQHLHGGGFGDQQRAGARQLPPFHHAPGAKAGGAFAGGEGEHQVAVQALPGGRQAAGGDDHGRHAALHVGGPAPIEPAVLDVGGEGVVAPGPGARRHGVEMGRENQGRAPAAAPQPGDHIGAAGPEAVELAFQAAGHQVLAHQGRDVDLAPRRVAAVATDQPACQRHDVRHAPLPCRCQISGGACGGQRPACREGRRLEAGIGGRYPSPPAISGGRRRGP